MRWMVGVVVLLWAAAVGAQPTVRGVGAVKADNAALLDIDVGPAQDRDLLVMICESDDPVSTPTGWTKVACSPSQNTNTEASAFIRVADCSGSGGAPDCDGACEACAVGHSGNHQMCGIVVVTRFTFDIADPLDACTTNTQATTTSVSISGTTSTVNNTLVFAVTAGAEQNTVGFSGWTNANLSSADERIDATTNEGNDGTLGVATGVRVSAGSWGTTTATGNSTTKANLSFNINPAPAGTNTPTATQTATITPTPVDTSTPTRTGTATATGTITNTPTPANTATRTATGTATSTATRTATITNTPTPTPTPALCDSQGETGHRAADSYNTCTGPEDEFAVLLVKNTPGGLGYKSDSVPRPFNEYRDANGVRIGAGSGAHILQDDASLTSSLDTKTIERGISPSWSQTLSAAIINAAGGVAKTIAAEISAAWSFTGALPKRNLYEFAPHPPIFIRCNDVPLDEQPYYCTFGGNLSATDDNGQTIAAMGCRVVRSSITLFDGEDRTSLPESCLLAMALIVEDVVGDTLCAISGDNASPDDERSACDPVALSDAQEWEQDEERGLMFGSSGAGCAGTVDVEAELSCAGE